MAVSLVNFLCISLCISAVASAVFASESFTIDAVLSKDLFFWADKPVSQSRLHISILLVLKYIPSRQGITDAPFLPECFFLQLCGNRAGPSIMFSVAQLYTFFLSIN
jgi:hypothetical protein